MLEGAEFRKARLEKKCSQTALAARCGLSRQQLVRIERGTRPATEDEARAIVRALGDEALEHRLCAACPLGVAVRLRVAEERQAELAEDPSTPPRIRAAVGA